MRQLDYLEKNGKTTIIAPELEVGRAKEESEDCNVITAERGDRFDYLIN